MRTITVLAHMSLDGVIQAPGGPDEDPSDGFTHGGWIRDYADPVLSAALRQQMSLPFDLLIGRKTFEIWAPYWPHHEDVWPNVNKATKYVVSSTLTVSEWQPTVFIHNDIAARISHLKQQDGPDLHVWGSSQLVQLLLAHDLVDTCWLMIYPLVLGSGKRLFGSSTIPLAFTVTDSHLTSKGVMIARYERDHRLVAPSG